MIHAIIGMMTIYIQIVEGILQYVFIAYDQAWPGCASFWAKDK